ncbi:MAG: iron-sulfur cluster insertion protein ErpA [Pseudomonadota bacterium]
MSVVGSYVPQALNITSSAASRVLSLIDDEQDDNLKLRVYVTGGGCSGFSYGFKLDSQVAEDDIEITKDGVGFLLDSLSYQYLVGSTLDFQEGLEGARFLVNNPNATVTCGCGSSFSV